MTFKLSEKEEALAKEFRMEHIECSSTFQYIFEPNGIGTVVTIKCPYCGETKDITDIDCW